MKKIIITFCFLIINILLCNKTLAYEIYEFGQKITYRNEEYYVIEYSDAKTDYIKLAKAQPFTVDELYKYGQDEQGNLIVNKYIQYYPDPDKVFYEYKNGIGGMSFYSSEDCSSYYDPENIHGWPKVDFTDCKNSYDLSDVNKLLINWSKDFQNDLVSVNGRKVGLITISDLINNFGFDSAYDVSDQRVFKSQDDIDWLFNSNYTTWVINDIDEDEKVSYLNESGDIAYYRWIKYSAVRPVIYLSKCYFGDDDCNECSKKYTTKKITKYKEYKLYDEIMYKGEKYHVIRNSNDSVKHVTLLKDVPLTTTEILKYDINNDFDDSTYLIKYYSLEYKVIKDSEDEKKIRRISRGDFDYSESNVKKIIDNWVIHELNPDDLVEIDGFKSRILKYEEYSALDHKEKNYVVDENYDYWMIGYENQGLYEYKKIRPVINVKKSVLGNDEYLYGDIVNYQGIEFYVLEDSDSSKDYVVLFMKKELNKRQILLYLNDYGVMSYYKSDTCDYNNVTDCSVNFNTSFIKTALDNWANDKNIMPDLITVNKYKIRLLTLDDLLFRLGYNPHYRATAISYAPTENVPEWMYNQGYDYWTMSTDGEINSMVFIILNQGTANLNLEVGVDNINDHIYDYNAVRPVINLNKCVLDGGCYEVEEEVVAECSNENNNTVDVENTLKIASKVLLIVSIILIIGGCIIIFYNYYKVRSNKK